jgi:hypothetical protein
VEDLPVMRKTEETGKVVTEYDWETAVMDAA